MLNLISDFSWILTPNVSVGGVMFGDSVEKYVKQYGLIIDPDPLPEDIFDDEPTPIVAPVSYCDPNKELYVYAELGMVEDICLHKHCFFKGYDLIGISYDSLKKLLDGEPVERDSDVLYENGSIAFQVVYVELNLFIMIDRLPVEGDVVSFIRCSS